MAIISHRKSLMRIILFTSISLMSIEAFSFSKPPADTDRDGVIDSSDLCAGTPNGYSVDSNGCAASQKDTDGDGRTDDIDAFPNNVNEWSDLDGDDVGDNSDTDIDGDGVKNTLDVFPLDATESVDFDGDGLGDNADDDDDNDNIPDADDPLNQIISSLHSAIPAVTEYLFDSKNNQMYLTHKGSNSMSIINAQSGSVEKTLTFSNMPERMALSPDGRKLYVALLVQEHSSYWWEEDQSGFIAVIDTQQLSVSYTLAINTDPYDLLVTSTGKLIVASGSGQRTDIFAYDATTGEVLGQSSIYQQSHLSLHPSEDWVFAANTGLSPSDIEKFDIRGVGITSIGDSPYHGDHRMEGGIWSLPNGEHVITRGGDVFLASDMTYVRSVLDAGIRINDVSFDEDDKFAYLLLSNDTIQLLNLTSLESFEQISLFGEVTAAYISGGNGYYISESNGEIYIIKEEHPCLSCATNTAPLASFSYDPISGDNSELYTFDASASSDLEDGSSLQYRWDMNGDGNWDTLFTSSTSHSQKFILAGTKYISLQVKDSSGLVSTNIQSIYVALGSEPGTEITDSIAFELQFAATDVQVDKVRSLLYVTDKVAKRLYVLDLTTGLTQRYFDFQNMPERMALSPDGQRLYVALLERDHDSTWWDEDQSGFIAVFNLETQRQINTLAINTDPYDLVVTSNDKLIVSSGSGQWTNIYAYDANTGEVLGVGGIRHRSRLYLHPDENWVFAADTGSSPSDIEQFDISGTGIVSIGDSPYHGDHRMNGNVWATPDGIHLITRGGDIFMASDMSYVESLTASNIRIEDLSFNQENQTIVVVASNGKIYRYDASSWQETGVISNMAETDFVVESMSNIYAIGQGELELLEF